MTRGIGCRERRPALRSGRVAWERVREVVGGDRKEDATDEEGEVMSCGAVKDRTASEGNNVRDYVLRTADERVPLQVKDVHK